MLVGRSVINYGLPFVLYLKVYCKFDGIVYCKEKCQTLMGSISYHIDTIHCKFIQCYPVHLTFCNLVW